MTNGNGENWKAYADSVSSANLSKALARGHARTPRAVIQKERVPDGKQKDVGKNSNCDVVKPK